MSDDALDSLTYALRRPGVDVREAPFDRTYAASFRTVDEERYARGLPHLYTGTLQNLEEELVRSVQIFIDRHGNCALDLVAFRGNSIAAGTPLDVETVRRYVEKCWDRLMHRWHREKNPPPPAALAQEACKHAVREISQAFDGGHLSASARHRAEMELNDMRRFIPSETIGEWEEVPEPKTPFLEGLEKIK